MRKTVTNVYLEFPSVTAVNTLLLYMRYRVARFCSAHGYGYSEEYSEENEYRVRFDCEAAYSMFTLSWDEESIKFILVP